MPLKLDSLSNWNPQVFREVKGRFKPQNVLATVATSLSVQLLVLLYFWTLLPQSTTYSNVYCTSLTEYGPPQCIQAALGQVEINWSLWWFDVFQTISWVFPFVLLVAGVYLLISDLSREERRGTLGFIRLSPQTSQSILLGKLIGVPCVLYLAMAVAVPLHLIAAIAAGVPLALVLSIYLVTAAACSVCFVGALLYALISAFLSDFQGWGGAVVVGFAYTICFQLFQRIQHGNIERPDLGLNYWFFLAIDKHPWLSLALALVTVGVGTYWLWQAANRRFRNPNATLLSKAQSYQATLCFEVWIIGFAYRPWTWFERQVEELALLSLLNVLWFGLLTVALTPSRQPLLDWARYRHDRAASKQAFWRRAIVQDLLWGEKSPALLAIALNLAIAVTLMGLWVLLWKQAHQTGPVIATVLLNATFVLIGAAIVQWLMFLKSSKRVLWAASSFAALVILPPVLLGVLQLGPGKMPLAWLFSVLPFAVLVPDGLSLSVAPLLVAAFLGHLTILTTLTLQLTRQIRQAGESETKALMARRS